MRACCVRLSRLLIVSVVVAGPLPLAAQVPLPLLDPECRADDRPGVHRLRSLAPAGDIVAAAAEPAAPSALVPQGAEPACRFGIRIPAAAPGAAGASLLRVRSLVPGGLISVQVSGVAAGWLPSTDRIDIASDGAIEAQELLLPGGLDGVITVRRLDLGPAPLSFDVVLDAPAALSPDDRDGATPSTQVADRGQNFRVTVQAADYRDLVTLAQRYTSRAKVDAALKLRVYRLLSTLLRRDHEQWRKSATRSEPIVAFVGLSGMNKMVLSDAVAWPMRAAVSADGQRLSEPWQTTFERGQFVWAVYVEEEDAPYYTSIDARFTDRAASVDHDDFEPQGVSRWDSGMAGADRVGVRIGYKRFRIPDQFDATQITFSRQSSNYGLRQWSSTFTRYGRYPTRLAAAVMAGFPAVKGRDFELAPVYGADPIAPSAFGLDEDSNRQPVFVLAAVRFPQLRDSESQAPLGLSRLWRNLLPEPVIGIGLPTINRRTVEGRAESVGFRRQSLAVGLSWPIFGDRVHFVAAAVRFYEAYAKPGVPELRVGDRYPLTTTIDDLREMRPVWKPLVGISIDLARTW